MSHASNVTPLSFHASESAATSSAVTSLIERLAATAVERDRLGGTPKLERDLIRQSGLLRFTIPERFGGAGANLAALLELVQRIARVDPSLAHVFAFHHLMLATVRLYGSEAQWSRAYADTARLNLFWGNALNPRDQRTFLHDRGQQYVVDGKKSFCSGARDSDRLIVSALAADTRKLVVAAIPTSREGVSTLPDWDAIGQRQTDSGTVELHQVRVEEEEILRTPGPLGSVFASLRSCIAQAILVHVYLGIAEGALEAARAQALASQAAAPGRGGDPYVLLRWGEMWVELEGARLLSQRARQALSDAWTREDALTQQERAEVAVQIATAKVASTRAGLDVATKLFEVIGARATGRAAAFDRYWRNLRTHTLHDSVDHKLAELGTWASVGTAPVPGFYS